MTLPQVSPAIVLRHPSSDAPDTSLRVDLETGPDTDPRALDTDLDTDPDAGGPTELTGEGVLRAVEGWARNELRNCAVAVRQIAYSQPSGVGESALLALSARLHDAADRSLADVLASFGR